MKKILLLICFCILLVGCDNNSNEITNEYKVKCTEDGDNYTYEVVLNVSNYDNKVMYIETTYRFNNFSEEEAEENIKDGCPVENDTCETFVEGKDSIFKWTDIDFSDYDSVDVEDIKELYSERNYICD